MQSTGCSEIHGIMHKVEKWKGRREGEGMIFGNAEEYSFTVQRFGNIDSQEIDVRPMNEEICTNLLLEGVY